MNGLSRPSQNTFFDLLPKVIMRYGSNFYTILHVTSSLIYVSSFSKFLLVWISLRNRLSFHIETFVFSYVLNFQKKKENCILYRRKCVLTPRPNSRILLALGLRPRASKLSRVGSRCQKAYFLSDRGNNYSIIFLSHQRVLCFLP